MLCVCALVGPFFKVVWKVNRFVFFPFSCWLLFSFFQRLRRRSCSRELIRWSPVVPPHWLELNNRLFFFLHVLKCSFTLQPISCCLGRLLSVCLSSVSVLAICKISDHIGGSPCNVLSILQLKNNQLRCKILWKDIQIYDDQKFGLYFKRHQSTLAGKCKENIKKSF